jgi:stress-induced morphogen
MTRLILMRKRPRISIGKSETRPEAMLARYTSESFQGNRLIKREEIVRLRLRNIIQAAIAIAIARERIIKWQEGMCWDKLQTVG